MTQPCIICYKIVSSNSLQENNIRDNDNGHIQSKLGSDRDRLNLFLKLFGRYVGKYDRDKQTNGDNGEGNSFWIEGVINAGILSCCGDCSKLVDTFCDLYHKQKSIELLLHWKVMTLRSVMACAQRVPSRVKEFREMVANQLKSDCGRVLGPDQIIDFKTNMVKKCRRRLGAPFPRLIIKQHGSCGVKNKSGELDTPTFESATPQPKNTIVDGSHLPTSNNQAGQVNLEVIAENADDDDNGLTNLDMDNVDDELLLEVDDVTFPPDPLALNCKAESIPTKQDSQVPNEEIGSEVLLLKTETEEFSQDGQFLPAEDNSVGVDEAVVENDMHISNNEPSKGRRNKLKSRTKHIPSAVSGQININEEKASKGDDQCTLDDPHPASTDPNQVTAVVEDDNLNDKDGEDDANVESMSHQEEPVERKLNNWEASNKQSPLRIPLPILISSIEVQRSLEERSIDPKIRFRCPRCLKLFHGKDYYKVHYRNTHLGLKFGCTSCNRLFARKTLLRAHVRREHPGIKNQVLASQTRLVRLKLGGCPRKTSPPKKTHRHMEHQNLGDNVKQDTPDLMETCFENESCPVAIPGPSKPHRKDIAEAETEKGQDLSANDDSAKPLHRSRLRSVHRCTKCLRTFSTPDRLRDHGKSGECTHGVLTDSEDSESEYYNDKEQDWEGDDNDDADDDDNDDMEEEYLEIADPKEKELSFVIINNPNSSQVGEPKCSIDLETKKQKCEICSKQFKNIATFESHWKVQHCQTRYKCKTCQQIFRRRDICIVHHRKFHQDVKYTQCDKAPVPNSEGGESWGSSKYMFRCPECDQSYYRLSQLLLHRKEAHNPPSDIQQIYVDLVKDGEEFVNLHIPVALFICPVDSCQQPFYYDKDLEDHSKLHGTFHCQFCEVTKPFAPDLAEHELEHGNSEGRKSTWDCARCKEPCWDRTRYIPHHLKAHQSLPWTGERCAICKQHEYSLNINLIRHYRDSHNLKDRDVQSIHRCKVPGCPTYFRHVQNITRHHKEVHQFFPAQLKELKLKRRRKAYPCKDCDKRFSTPAALRFHRMRVHVKASGHECCPDCKYVCETKPELDKHVRTWHPKGASRLKECPKCKKAIHICAYTNHLKFHQRKEDMEGGLADPKPATKHVCEFCGKNFKAKEHLQKHYLSHSGPDSWEFVCSVCSKKCLTKQKLEEHMRTHSKEKPFVCEVCGQKYAHRHNLRNHVNSKHGEGDAKADPPKKYNRINFTSRKGIKRKQEDVDVDDTESD